MATLHEGGDEPGARGHKSPRRVLHHKLTRQLTDAPRSRCVLELAAYMRHSPAGSSPPLDPFACLASSSSLSSSSVLIWLGVVRETAKGSSSELREGESVRGGAAMKIQCDACEGAAATVVCCADEAALCARCDVEIHAANKLASKHQRLPLEALSARLPRCDVCQEKAAFIFCVEDRALFCRDCDEPIHVPGTLSGNHQRYLATGIRVGAASAPACSAGGCDAHDSDHHAPPKATVEAPPPQPAVSADAQKVPSPPQFLPQGWAVDELLQFSDYESGDKLHKESPLGFKELEWFADIDLFHDQAAPKAGGTLAEVPELFGSQAASDAAYYRPSKTAGAGVRQSKKARIEVTDDEEDYLIVPDLGY